jgi:predicted SnoaL-like aldol condensation-catalyzing enzyme
MRRDSRWRIGLGVILMALLTVGVTEAQTAKTAANKALVIRFYNALVQGDVATLRALGRPDYIQHNPAFPTGLDGLAQRISERPARPVGSPPIPPLEFVRSAAEGDFVWLLRKMPAPGPGKERANVDIFRVQDGKVAEHWDYQETFPRGDDPPRNDNGRF